MLKVEYKDIEIKVTFDCPHCGTENVEIIDREPDEFDTSCENCSEFFTVKCYGD